MEVNWGEGAIFGFLYVSFLGNFFLSERSKTFASFAEGQFP
jgi:hypothetical protein